MLPLIRGRLLRASAPMVAALDLLVRSRGAWLLMPAAAAVPAATFRRLAAALVVALPAATAMIATLITTAMPVAMVAAITAPIIAVVAVITTATHADHHRGAAIVIGGRRVDRGGGIIAATAIAGVVAGSIRAWSAIDAAGETKGEKARRKNMFHDGRYGARTSWRQSGGIIANPRHGNPDSPSRACRSVAARHRW